MNPEKGVASPRHRGFLPYTLLHRMASSFASGHAVSGTFGGTGQAQL